MGQAICGGVARWRSPKVQHLVAQKLYGVKDMDFENQTVPATGIRISVMDNETEVGRAYLYVMHNDLHERPFGLMEDVYVDEACRGKGVGSELVKQVIRRAREANCYKLIATSRISRSKVHDLYRRLGFTQHGFEFRISF